MTEREALKLALEALTNAYWPTQADLIPAHNIKECAEAITAIKEALAQPKHIGFMDSKLNPIQRTWVGLTDEEIQYCVELKNPEAIAEEVEAKLKEKNT